MIVRREGLSPFWNVVVVCFGVLLLVVALMAVAQHLSSPSHHLRPLRRVAAWRLPRGHEVPPLSIVDRRAQRSADFYWETNDLGEWRWIRTGRRRLLRMANGLPYEVDWHTVHPTDPVRPDAVLRAGSHAAWWQWETNSDFEYRFVRYERSSNDAPTD